MSKFLNYLEALKEDGETPTTVDNVDLEPYKKDDEDDEDEEEETI